MKIFNKAAVFADLHLGKKHNSVQFNEDSEQFILWFIEEAKKWNADSVIFCGDWHDNRRNINISTLNYSLRCMEHIDKNFDQWYFIPGNHDLYYKDKRDLSSIEIARNLKNCTIIRDPVTIGDVSFVPWLVEDEWKSIKSIKSKYIFGHFELPYFLMNQMFEMPDNGGLNKDSFKNVEYVFTGHFHKRQNKNNVYYIGSPFPQTFSDVWDDERGMMFLEWDKEPEFKKWPFAPKFRTINLSSLLEKPNEYIDDKTYAKVNIDLNLKYDEIQFIKELYMEYFDPREFIMIPASKNQNYNEDYDTEISFKNIEQIVIEGLNSVESFTIDNKKLIEIYNSL